MNRYGREGGEQACQFSKEKEWDRALGKGRKNRGTRQELNKRKGKTVSVNPFG